MRGATNVQRNDVVTAGSFAINTATLSQGNITWSRAGKLVTITCSDMAFNTTGYNLKLTNSDVPKPRNGFVQVAMIGALGEARGLLQMTTQYGLIANYGQATGILNYGSITYITDEGGGA